MATTEAVWSLPPGPTMTMRQATQQIGRGGDEPTLGHGNADQQHSAVAVVGCSSTMEFPAASAAAGTAFGHGQRRHRPGGIGVGRRGPERVSEAGESSTTTQATTAMTAPTPTRTMTALR